jgi:hypothetical protein
MEQVGSAIWYILWPFGNLLAIWYIFPCFGILFQEKSGSTGLRFNFPMQSINAATLKLNLDEIFFLRFLQRSSIQAK